MTLNLPTEQRHFFRRLFAWFFQNRFCTRALQCIANCLLRLVKVKSTHRDGTSSLSSCGGHVSPQARTYDAHPSSTTMDICCSVLPGASGRSEGSISQPETRLDIRDELQVRRSSDTVIVEQVTQEIPALSLVVTDVEVYPIDPYETERYDRRVDMERGFPENCTIPRMTLTYDQHPSNLSPWERFVHPEGAVYFWDNHRRVVTDAYLIEEDVYKKIDLFISHVEDYDHKYNLGCLRDENIHLYIQHNFDGSLGYYFVNHHLRKLFWLDTKLLDHIVGELQVAQPSLTHIGLEITSQYWLHNERYPHTSEVPQDALHELRDILWHDVSDLLVSSESTVPFSVKDARKMQALVNEIEAQHEKDGRSSIGARTVIYRFLSALTHYRYMNFYGEKAARLSRHQSLFKNHKRTWYMDIISPLLFYAPEGYLKKLQLGCVDGLVHMPSWNALLTNLTSEWKDYILYATVLLAANMSFLGLYTKDFAFLRGLAPSQLNYISLTLSIASVTLGLVLVRQHNTTLDRQFLAQRSVSATGLETLAVMYSLPYTLVLYAMITFFIALSIVCFRRDNLSTIIVLCFAWGVLLFLLFWCISTSFEYNVYEYSLLFNNFEVLRDKITRWFRRFRQRLTHEVSEARGDGFRDNGGQLEVMGV